MTDVRLTALNPEDSKVYPVACNSSGELLTNKSGDINLDVPGNLVVGGKITGGIAQFTNTVETGGGDVDNYGLIVNNNTSNLPTIIAVNSGTGRLLEVRNTAAKGLFLENDGDATLSGDCSFANTRVTAFTSNDNGLVRISNASGITVIDLNGINGSITAGNCIIAGNKAGFTADGHLWCTTVRGQTVILDATSNGLATWADYTPPTRRDILEQKIDQLKSQKPEPDSPGPAPDPEIETE